MAAMSSVSDVNKQRKLKDEEKELRDKREKTETPEAAGYKKRADELADEINVMVTIYKWYTGNEDEEGLLERIANFKTDSIKLQSNILFEAKFVADVKPRVDVIEFLYHVLRKTQGDNNKDNIPNNSYRVFATQVGSAINNLVLVELNLLEKHNEVNLAGFQKNKKEEIPIMDEDEGIEPVSVSFDNLLDKLRDKIAEMTTRDAERNKAIAARDKTTNSLQTQEISRLKEEIVKMQQQFSHTPAYQYWQNLQSLKPMIDQRRTIHEWLTKE
jgi:hypothetical protein